MSFVLCAHLTNSNETKQTKVKAAPCDSCYNRAGPTLSLTQEEERADTGILFPSDLSSHLPEALVSVCLSVSVPVCLGTDECTGLNVVRPNSCPPRTMECDFI